MVKVLFVCTGNTCRSPMAEAILKNMNKDGVEVRSRGIYAIDGQDASHFAKQVLTENQIEHSHCSQQLKEEDVSWADYIITMTSSHKNQINRLYPQVSNKVFTLKEFTDGSNEDISDPFGGTIDIYRKTFAELKKAIEILANKI